MLPFLKAKRKVYGDTAVIEMSAVTLRSSRPVRSVGRAPPPPLTPPHLERFGWTDQTMIKSSVERKTRLLSRQLFI